MRFFWTSFALAAAIGSALVAAQDLAAEEDCMTSCTARAAQANLAEAQACYPNDSVSEDELVFCLCDSPAIFSSLSTCLSRSCPEVLDILQEGCNVLYDGGSLADLDDTTGTDAVPPSGNTGTQATGTVPPPDGSSPATAAPGPAQHTGTGKASSAGGLLSGLLKIGDVSKGGAKDDTAPAKSSSVRHAGPALAIVFAAAMMLVL